MQKILLSLLLLSSASAFAQFSENDKQAKPNAARLLSSYCRCEFCAKTVIR